jgi:hypothetical protein
MPRPRIGTTPVTVAERQARHRARLRHGGAPAPAARRIPPRAATPGDGCGNSDQPSGRIPRLAGQFAGQPVGIDTGGKSCRPS